MSSIKELVTCNDDRSLESRTISFEQHSVDVYNAILYKSDNGLISGGSKVINQVLADVKMLHHLQHHHWCKPYKECLIDGDLKQQTEDITTQKFKSVAKVVIGGVLLNYFIPLGPVANVVLGYGALQYESFKINKSMQEIEDLKGTIEKCDSFKDKIDLYSNHLIQRLNTNISTIIYRTPTDHGNKTLEVDLFKRYLRGYLERINKLGNELTIRSLPITTNVPLIDQPCNGPFECQVCGTNAEKTYIKCDGCETPSHQECFDYVGNCSVFSCGSTSYSNLEDKV